MSQTFKLSDFKYSDNLREFTGHLGIFWNSNSSQDSFKGELKDNGAFVIQSKFNEPGNRHNIVIFGKIVDSKFEAKEGSYARLNGEVTYKSQ